MPFLMVLFSLWLAGMDLQVLLLENDINNKPFSQQVLACLPPLPWSISPEDLQNTNRKDLRSIRVFSVDPPGKGYSSLPSQMLDNLKLMDFSNKLSSSLFFYSSSWFFFFSWDLARLVHMTSVLCRLQGHRWRSSLYAIARWKLWSGSPYPQKSAWERSFWGVRDTSFLLAC